MTRRKNPAAAAQEELADFLDDVVEMARSSTGLDADKIEEIKQGFRRRIEELGSDAKSAAEGVFGHAEDAIEQADRYAHEKPWQLVVAAGLVGLALGVLVARR